MAFRSRQLVDGQRFVRQGRLGPILDPVVMLPAGATIDHHVRNDRRTTVLATTQLGTVLIDGGGPDDTELSVCSASREHTDQLFNTVAERCPPPPAHYDDVPIAVWYQGLHGPVVSRKRLTAPAWEDVDVNYPEPVRRNLDDLASIRDIGEGGKLIIWHGPPGTGKTTALRSLIRSWQHWCGAHYVVDPERFFANPGYIAELLSSAASPAHTTTANWQQDEHAVTWQLVIAEDCDEYLRATARRDAGAALGRLLNLSDGILGQGHQTLILLTTNEELHRLHPAVIRPGRCLAVVEFTKFKPAEAQRWLDPSVAPPTSPTTLAELYERSGRMKRITCADLPAAMSGQYL
jgi:hypothetical protein